MDTQKRKIIDFQDCEVCGLVRPLGFECPFCAVKRLEADIEKLQRMKLQELKGLMKTKIKVIPVCMRCGSTEWQSSQCCKGQPREIRWMEPDVHDLINGMTIALNYAMDQDPNFMENMRKSVKS